MTSILQARDELDTALSSGGVPIADSPGGMAPPYGVIFGDGIDLTHVGRGQMQATFRYADLRRMGDGTGRPYPDWHGADCCIGHPRAGSMVAGRGPAG